jgi:hypothetical protein
MYDTTQNEVSATYMSNSDTALVFYDTTNAIDFRLGKVIGGNVITGIEVKTENENWPEITISGEVCPDTDADVEKYDPSDLEVSGARTATPIGVTADTVSDVNGASASMSVEVGRILDSQGALKKVDVWGGRIEATNDLVSPTAVPGAAADTGWTLKTPMSKEEANEEYVTGSITVIKNVTRDT